jgi:tetratricopeptide (TPR) repeat protein
MVRATRHKQSRRLAGPRKPSSTTRRGSGSRRASSHEAARRLALVAKANANVKAFAQPLRKRAGVEYETTLKNFETAVRYFQRKDYEKAVALFEKVAVGPIQEMADRARVHLRFCESKRHQESRPKTAEGYYARGVAALNSREFDRALQYLTKSDEMVPNQEYVHYALAAAYGLRGNSDKAMNHLERAIQLRPQNRVQARHDEDFQVLAGDPRFTRLFGTNVRRPLAPGN